MLGPLLLPATYRSRGVNHVDTDDFMGSATVSINDRTVNSNDYYTLPVSVTHRNINRGLWMQSTIGGVPGYLLGDYDYYYSSGPPTRSLAPVTVTALWGWDRVPDAVTYAVGLMAVRLFRRPDDAALGIVATDYGGVYLPGFDSDVEASLAPYRVVSGL